MKAYFKRFIAFMNEKEKIRNPKGCINCEWSCNCSLWFKEKNNYKCAAFLLKDDYDFISAQADNYKE